MNTPTPANGLMLLTAFAQLQKELRHEGRHSDAHHVLTVQMKLTDEQAERVLWIMLDIMAGRRDAQGAHAGKLEAPAQEPGTIAGRIVAAITHQGPERAQ